MANGLQEIRRIVKEHILAEFLPGADPGSLKDDTPLITGGILDSVGMVEFVLFLEQTYGIEFLAEEVTPTTMDTVAGVARAVRAKIEKGA